MLRCVKSDISTQVDGANAICVRRVIPSCNLFYDEVDIIFLASQWAPDDPKSNPDSLDTLLSRIIKWMTTSSQSSQTEEAQKVVFDIRNSTMLLLMDIAQAVQRI